MSDSLALLVLVAIFALAAFLIVLPRIMRRREAGPAPRPGGLAAPPRATPEAVVPPEAEVEGSAEVEGPVEVEAPGEPVRLRDRIGKTRASFAGLLGTLRRGGKIDDEAWDELEEALLLADVGMTTTEAVVQGVRTRVAATGADATLLPELLRDEITERLEGTASDRSLQHAAEGPTVWLMVGVNGVGKTTLAGKLAARFARESRPTLLVAADTFRAAATEQLEVWAERAGVELVKARPGSDPSAVVHDALSAATARGTEIVLVDTAGRLHTKHNLMNELEKIGRVCGRVVPGAPHHVLLVLDATLGQNGLQQAREFQRALPITSLALTKLDGTARGGAVLAIVDQLGLPVSVVGIGEGLDDWEPFDPEAFARGLFE